MHVQTIIPKTISMNVYCCTSRALFRVNDLEIDLGTNTTLNHEHCVTLNCKIASNVKHFRHILTHSDKSIGISNVNAPPFDIANSPTRNEVVVIIYTTTRIGHNPSLLAKGSPCRTHPQILSRLFLATGLVHQSCGCLCGPVSCLRVIGL